MSTLTAEQRQRMEENRRKAMERRQAAMAGQQNSGPSTSSGIRHPIPLQNPIRAPVPGPSVQPTSSFYNNPRPQSSTTYPNSRPPVAAPPPPRQQFTGPTITGVSYLLTHDRFVTDMPYQAQAITVFRSITGSRYDAQTRRWSFPLSEHNNLMLAMEPLKPKMVIGQLPPYILRLFGKKATETTDNSHIEELMEQRIDPVLRRALLPFQREGIIFGINRGGRVLIADDMGLGKTIQSLGIANYYMQDWPLLIVTPSSMRYTWRDSIWQWLPAIHGISVVESIRDDLTLARVIIMSYDLLQRRSNEPALSKCGVIIMDESHHLKNFKTARSKAAIPLLKGCKRALLLTGTPALSRPIELYNQINVLTGSDFPSYTEFGIRYCNGRKNPFGWDFSGSSNMSELQLVLQATIMIRRLKSDVLQQLPSKRRQMFVLDPMLVKLKKKSLQEKANAYRQCKKGQSHNSLLEYYSETGEVKIDAVINYIKELVESDKKFLCFAHHQVVLRAICEALDSVQCEYVKIDGSTKSEDRKIAVDRFQFRDNVKVAVLSITAANTGITLTAANLVVFAELYWNPGVLVQAEDRAHRIGQMDSVVVQYLVAKGTADDDLWNMLLEKLDVLSKAGLSKDNFREANCDLLQQQSHSNAETGQKPINEYFKPQPSTSQQRQQSQEVKENCPDGMGSDDFFDPDVAALLDDTGFPDSTLREDDDIFTKSDSNDSIDAFFANLRDSHLQPAQEKAKTESTKPVSPFKKFKFSKK